MTENLHSKNTSPARKSSVTPPQNFDQWRQRNGISFDNYLGQKLPLFSNLEDHFTSVKPLREILAAYSFDLSRSLPQEELKKQYKRQLITAGIYHGEDILEFVLLVGEKERKIKTPKGDYSDEELGQYYFNQYKGAGEYWHSKTFRFFRDRSHSYQQSRSKILEEVSIYMLVQSRASRAMALDPPPTEAVSLIHAVDDYFQRAFPAVFKRNPPLRLKDVTNVTRQATEHADAISKKTFIDETNLIDPAKFMYIVLHEGLHLCFEGFNQPQIEEGLIEYLIAKMFAAARPDIIFSSVSDAYGYWRENLENLFAVIPGSEDNFMDYFLNGGHNKLRLFLKGALRSAEKEKISRVYIRYDSDFLDAISRFVKEK